MILSPALSRVPLAADRRDIPPRVIQTIMQVDFGTGFIWFVAFLFSTTVHEAMHAFTAWRLGGRSANRAAPA